MCHSSGLGFLPEHGEFARINYTLDHTLAEAVRAYAGEKLVAEPGTKYLYSNMGIATLGRIVEVLSGQKYEEFVQRRILTCARQGTRRRPGEVSRGALSIPVPNWASLRPPAIFLTSTRCLSAAACSAGSVSSRRRQ